MPFGRDLGVVRRHIRSDEFSWRHGNLLNNSFANQLSLPEMVFILSSPRSGSTLLRVMLAGHSHLFSPPELNLLPFCTMSEREMRFGATSNWLMDCDQRVGLTQAVMNLTGMDIDNSEAFLRRCVEQDICVERMYAILREMATPRRLVDKATLNASCLWFLEKSTRVSPCAHYIHLVRHPYSVVESLERNYLKDIPKDDALQTAEALWTVPNRNILWFLSTLQPGRCQRIYFEDLVRDPEHVMRVMCEFLEVAFEKELLEPYDGERMTGESPGRFKSLGDPNFNNHRGIDSSLAEAWKDIRVTSGLSCLGRQLAAEFRYELP